MKGRTTCPRCKHGFVMDAPDNSPKCEVMCPNCKNKFTIQPASTDSKSGDDCYWEEHGEPRKTILSSIKPRTDKPTIAAVLLIAVFALGITSAVFTDAFIEAPLDTLSTIGMTGTVELVIIDQSNNSIGNVSVTIDDVSNTANANLVYSFKNISPGLKTVELSLDGYKTQTREILVVPFIVSSHKITMNEEDEIDKEYIPFESIGLSIILVIFSVFALLAALMAFERRHLDVAIVGSIISIFSFGFFMIGSIISIIALIIILKYRDEFENGKKGKIF